MTTRAEMVAMLNAIAEANKNKLTQSFGHPYREVAATLTRDGELRERLEKLVEEWPNRQLPDPVRRHCGCGTDYECIAHAHAANLADELSALLKEEVP